MKIRLCVDFREVNKWSIGDKYPLPRVDDLIEGIDQNKINFFSTMDR